MYKRQIVDRFTKRGHVRPDVDKKSPDIRIMAHLGKGKANITLDLSGPALHQRFYRQGTGEAPLKENLAAAMIARSGWAGEPMMDPMCGSGTLPVSYTHLSSLGLMKNSIKDEGQRLGIMPASARHAALSSNLLILTKSNSKSRVHRPAYVDYIGIKRFDEHGKVVGEDRFIGLYASSIYNASATQIPLISHRLERIMAASGFESGSHAYKALLNVLETYPRDELIQALSLIHI